MEMTVDRAIELLEITDISGVSASDLPQIGRRAQRRWHPDRVAHLANPELTSEYTEKFQAVETACELIRALLSGSYRAGEAFTRPPAAREEPEDVIRRNAPDIQETLRRMWGAIKERRYKWSEQEVVLSDGFSLRSLLKEDFEEDIAVLSVVSFFYGVVFLGVLTAIASGIHPILGGIVGIIWVMHAASSILGVAPLSRFWLPEQVQDVMIKFINVGLSIYNWAEEQAQSSANTWVVLLVRLPVLFAKFVKYLVLLPAYELAKAFVGDRIVGVVTQRVHYYANAAEWYVDELLRKEPREMSGEELLHLSYLHSELSSAEVARASTG